MKIRLQDNTSKEIVVYTEIANEDLDIMLKASQVLVHDDTALRVTHTYYDLDLRVLVFEVEPTGD